MIPNQWYVVLDSSQVKDKPVGVTRMGEKLVFWRDAAGKLYCLRDRCVHRGVQLSKGKVINDHLQCPFHGFEYDNCGQVTVIPANGKRTPVPKAFKAHSYPVHEEHGFVWIWWGETPPTDLRAPRFFSDIDTSLSYAQVYDPWKIHYSRAIENQLDVMHLPFVHYNTIGRGGATLVDGPGVKWLDENMFYVFVHNRLDDGSQPLKPSEFPLEPEPSFKLEFIFPNLWQNYISEKVRIMVAFVPVDAENTILYLRFYQKFMQIPVLRNLVNRLAMPSNIYIAHQDRRVVETQEPKASDLRIQEQLIRGDYPIVEYRRRRAELKAAAQVIDREN
jgi:phenylpropionate dioxygenase-like ring-hydroxylating dioxygenase large terminal subunit